jgi:hypothetical protein
LELVHTLIPKLISALISLLDATNLRNRVYTQQERICILETALDDIQRINSASAANPLIHNICLRVNTHDKYVDNKEVQ